MSGSRGEPVEVCLRCGSLDPRVPAPACSHPEVARLQELRPELVDLLARIRRLENALAGQLRTLGEVARLEVASGRARFVADPPVYSAGSNVMFLRRRSELANPDGSPRVAPSREAPVEAAPGLRLTPTSATKRPKRPKAESRPKAREPVPGQASLLEA